jgi:hypothetical protein
VAVGLSAAEDHPVNEVLPFGQMFVYGRRAEDGSTRSEIDLPPQPKQQESETSKQ